MNFEKTTFLKKYLLIIFTGLYLVDALIIRGLLHPEIDKRIFQHVLEWSACVFI